MSRKSSAAYSIENSLTSVHSRIVRTLPLFEAYRQLDLPQENLFASAAWQSVLRRTYGLKLFCKYILGGDGRPASHIIYAVVENFLERKICVGSYCDYLDNRMEHPDDWRYFFQAIRREYPDFRIAVRNLKDEAARACPDFRLVSREKHHEIPLQDAPAALWQQSPATFKRACRRALKSGVTVRRCDLTQLPAFYRLHLRLRKNKYGIFPQPYRFFENIWDAFMSRDQGVLLGAFNQSGAMIAGQIFLVCGDTLFYKFSASDPHWLHQKPNNLLMWEGIMYAKEKGLERLDLGSSGIDQPGLIWFKAHIAGKTIERDIHHLGFAPPGYRCRQKRLLKAYTRIGASVWTPEPLVKFGSRLIYPYLA